MNIVYQLGPNEGPEPKNLVRHGITVVPGQVLKVDPEWGFELFRSYPQIQGADAASQARLEKMAEKAEKAGQ